LLLDHSGAFSQGTRTSVKLSVYDGLGIIVLANCFPTGWPEGIADSFFDAVYHNGSVSRDWPAFFNAYFEELAEEGDSGGVEDFTGTPPGGMSLGDEAYVGTYVNDYVGTVYIATNGTMNGTSAGNLALSFADSNRTFALTHWDRDLFVMYANQNERGGAVTFAIGATGNASSVTIEILNGNGGGVLTRQTNSSN
jgi:hypothetical protein